jgi:uncharacterized protein YgbK (DUF1537 family)
VCGSASAKTRAHIAHAADTLPTRKLDIEAIATDPESVIAETVSWLQSLAADDIPVVYSVGSLDDIRRGSAGNTVAGHIEGVLSEIVSRAVESLGVTQVIVAGGETSGAVVQHLGIQRLHIGPRIAPGVCWSAADATHGALTIALKSGNFGSDDMFTTAWRALDDLTD